MKYDNQLRYTVSVVETYRGEMPLAAWLKNYFRENKQMGSRDRRLLGGMVYSYYRLGHAERALPVKERLLLAFFLCQDQPSEFLGYFSSHFNQSVGLPLEQKLAIAKEQYPGFAVGDIFPWADELSDSIDHEAFCLSFLRQPDLFLRIRPGHEKAVLRALPQGEFIPPWTVRLGNGFKVEELFTPDLEVVVQDYSSQRIGEFLRPGGSGAGPDGAEPRTFWDACAASGGKSILAHDLYPKVKLTVSDIRPSILHNLKQRFAKAGIHQYKSFVVDLSQSAPSADAVSADLILADVPCTGSGTWARTPEDLYFFKPEKIAHYTAIQKKIVTAIASRLSPGARLVYSTCSVFKKENEVVLDYVADLPLQRMENIKGYTIGADTMFAAAFVR